MNEAQLKGRKTRIENILKQKIILLPTKNKQSGKKNSMLMIERG